MEPDDIARARSLPLEAVLQSLGAQRDAKDPAHNWRYGASRITVTEARFFDHNHAGALHRMRAGRAGGGGAIDLVQYLKDVGFREAVRSLGTVDSQSIVASVVASQRDDRLGSPSGRLPPIAMPERAQRVEWYLREVRAIPQALVVSEMQSGSVFADVRGNAVFRLRDVTGQEVGYEVRGTHGKPFHSVHGEKGAFITKADGTRTAAFVESAIEALSYRALKGTGLIVSTTGSAIERPGILARALHARGYDIVAAFNADKTGDRMAERLRETLGSSVRRDRPSGEAGKDWNDELHALRARGREFGRSQPIGQEPPARAAEPSR